MWAIKMPSGKFQGQYQDDNGFVRYNAWNTKREAKVWLDKLTKDAKELVTEFNKEGK